MLKISNKNGERKEIVLNLIEKLIRRSVARLNDQTRFCQLDIVNLFGTDSVSTFITLLGSQKHQQLAQEKQKKTSLTKTFSF